MGNKAGEFRGNRTTFEKWVLGPLKRGATDIEGLSRGVRTKCVFGILRRPTKRVGSFVDAASQ